MMMISWWWWSGRRKFLSGNQLNSFAGQIGRFDFMSLLVNLVAAAALLAVAVRAVEFLMLNVLPERALYTKEKIRETKDFSDVRDELKRRSASSSTAPSPMAEKSRSPSLSVAVQSSAPFDRPAAAPGANVTLQMPTPYRPSSFVAVQQHF